ncbi:MAG TPA: DUF2231 domain-containing protein [Lysobacter sp.]
MRHPLHPALVHFPVATWSLASLADAGALIVGEPAWRLAGIAMAVGTVMALPAMALGFVDFLKIPAGSAAERDARRHMAWVSAAWCAYAASLLLRLDGTSLIAPGVASLCLGAAGFVALCVAGWLGGKLVYVHGVNVHRAR